MGKAVAGLFFVLAFVVFVIIKHAAKGVRDAYRVVNDSPSTNPSSPPLLPAPSLDTDFGQEEGKHDRVVSSHGFNTLTAS
jgi:hypothetical protein